MRRVALWAPLGVFAVLVALVAIGLLRPADRAVESAMVGHRLPQFALPPAAGSRPGLATADLAGGAPKLLNVWASWCVPCRAEAPQLAALARAGVPIMGVAIRDARADVDAFLGANGNPYARIGLDARSVVQLGIGSSGVPETFVVDGAGVIRYQHIGEIRPEHVPMLLDRLREAGA